MNDAGYTLLDFGDGRKLEQFGALRLDRPSPAAQEFSPAAPDLWQQADARYELAVKGSERGRWKTTPHAPATWRLQHGRLNLELRRTPFGHVGVFPEQAENWDWLRRSAEEAVRPWKLLNLFAYTGASTLAAAGGLRRHGAKAPAIVHVDSAEPAVQWGRRNAELSGLSAAPIRWIVEDAAKFVARELKRGNRYDGIILDPPSYGHGPRGELWRIEEHLPQLLKHALQLTAGDCRLLLLTCHSPGWGPRELALLVHQVWPLGSPFPDLEASPLELRTASGRALPSGAMARFVR